MGGIHLYKQKNMEHINTTVVVFHLIWSMILFNAISYCKVIFCKVLNAKFSQFTVETNKMERCNLNNVGGFKNFKVSCGFH